jgi:hypothetical protein
MQLTLSWPTFILTVVLLTACVGRPVPTSGTAAAIDQIEPIASPTQKSSSVSPTADFSARFSTPVATPSPDVNDISPDPTPTEGDVKTRYQLTAELNYDAHLLTVNEQIFFTNSFSEAIPDFLLLVEPSRYPSTFHLKSLTWGNQTPVEDYRQDIGQIYLPLRQPIKPGESVVLSISYELNLPSPDPSFYGRPVPFGYTPTQTNLVDWYPFLPPYQPGHGWWVNQAGPFGEHLVYDSVDFEVSIRLVGERDDLVVAASAPPTVDGDWLHYEYPAARNFVWSVSDQYIISFRQVGMVTIKAYTFPIHPAAGESALQATAEALELYSGLFGEYPRDLLSVVEADFLDGMEYDGLYFLSKGFYNLYTGTPAEYLTAIAAHETAHQWWYAQVGNDQAIEPWLDEALCTYSEQLFYEYIHPEALVWWQQYRIDYYAPQGWVDGTIYNPEGYRAYRDAIYLNGAVFLDDLRSLIGNQIFLNFLRNYAQKNIGNIVTADDFFNLLNTYSNEDLTPLLDKYFYKR